MTLLSALFLFIGSYCSADDAGLKVYGFDETTGTPTFLCQASGVANPSFLCLSADGCHVYSVNEDEGMRSMACHLRFDATVPSLTLGGARLTHGGAPCNIALAPDGRSLYTANYMGGNVTMFPVEEGGALGRGKAVAFSGKGPDAERQDQPHLHAVNFTRDGRYMLANDLGTDCIHLFPRRADGTYAQPTSDVKLPARMGPRHLCFSADGTMAYVLGEISGEIVCLRYNPSDGTKPFTTVQTIKADPHDGEGSADIHLSPDGRFLYASHRLKGDGISVFSVASEGTLQSVGYQTTGRHPRNFAITPNGRYLLVACRDTNEVEIYERDSDTGLLTDTGKRIATPKPVCLVFREYPR